jgi:hypothetical protein
MAIPVDSDGGIRANNTFRTISEMLDNGECEPAKAVVHGVLMAMVTVCAAYNMAAWLKRRETHLAINAVLYSAAIWWERCHVVHHLRSCASSTSTVRGGNSLEHAA